MLLDDQHAVAREARRLNGGAGLLDELSELTRRFVVMTSAQADVVALWIVHTYGLEAADATPYLSIRSAEKRSGKSRLLEVLQLLAHRPVAAASTSEAALFRVISSEHPTLLMDEIDAVFGAKRRDGNEDLRALLNAGYRRGTPVLRCVGEGTKQKVERFDVFCPKALAGIGEPPDTIADRSLPIRLKRRAPSERVERFRVSKVEPLAGQLRARIQVWVEEQLETLTGAEPELPDELDDRAQDAAEPLLAIAEAAGYDWPERARAAVVELRTGGEQEDASLGVRLLVDARRIFQADGDRIATAELIQRLSADEESPWADWGGRGPITPRPLASLLKKYGIRSRTVWLPDGKTAKGYKREDFEDAWRRYLPSETSGASEPALQAALGSVSLRQDGDGLTDGEKGANPHQQTILTHLTDSGADTGRAA